MAAPVRVYLAGRIAVECGDRLLTEDLLPRRQGRLALAFLAVERARPVARDELAEAVWGEDLPDSWDRSLAAIVSKLRAALKSVGLDGSSVIPTSSGCHQLVLPAGSVVDIEQSIESLHEAEVLGRAGRWRDAHMPAVVARAIARRSFLAGEDRRWADEVRSTLRGVLLRALDVLIESHLALGEHTEAAQRSEAVLALEPFREGGWRGLMRSHAAAGNVGEALRAYERCRVVLAEELGVPPSSETRRLHGELLASIDDDDAPAPSSAPEPTTVAVTFVDVVGSTQGMSADLRRQLFARIRRVTTAHAGAVVKTLGDGAMLVHHAVEPAFACAVALRDAAADLGLALRVGLHFGEATKEEGDYFGRTVVIASRLCDAAAPATVVVSDLAKHLTGGTVGCTDLGDLHLKGVDDPVRCWAIA